MSASHSDIREAKNALRQSIRSKLPAATTGTITAQSLTAQNLILATSEYTSATRIGIYLSMPVGEANTDLLVRDALSNGKAVFVPYLHRPKGSAGPGKGRRVMDMLRLRDVAEYEGLERDRWGIPSLGKESVERRENGFGGQGPEGEADRVGIEEGGLDLIVVPGVAFDAEGRRLGHGAGFYDEFLARYCEGGKRTKPYLGKTSATPLHDFPVVSRTDRLTTNVVGLCLAEQFIGIDSQIPTTEWDWKVDAVAMGSGRLVTCNNT
ncbi:hypothetical protein LTR95_010053 [Oleoguttula sp. CCFEE 5521]